LRIIPPAALVPAHRLDAFECTHASLTDWLRQRAMKNQANGASRCFVVCDGARVVGYYALAAGSVEHVRTPGNIRRNMPDPIPVLVLGRLAVHRDYLGLGIGAGLLKDAVLRSQRAATDIGARALLCHAIDDAAKAFYLHHGFVASPIDALTVMLKLEATR
jgi:GNAT superfamily N-acetyltransferase